MNIRYTAILTMAMLLAACADDENSRSAGNSGNEWKHQGTGMLLKYDIGDGQSRKKTGTTRADVVEYNNDLENYDISVTAMVTEGGRNSEEEKEESYFSDVLQFKQEQGWTLPNKYYWPAGKLINSYGLAPHNAEGVVAGNSVKTFTYTVPYDNSKQCDLMYAYTHQSARPVDQDEEENQGKRRPAYSYISFMHWLPWGLVPRPRPTTSV